MPGTPPQLPVCTYRVQLHKGFTFDDAAGIADYLAWLGISHLYCSPYLQARPGSLHGYDTIDYSRPNDELGGSNGHRRLVEALREHGLGQVLDIVPNHMALAGPDNTWWWSLLRDGPASPYAAYFDIDWDAPEPHLRGKILLPILEDHYGRVLDARRITLVRTRSEFRIHYRDHILPVNFCSLAGVLGAAAERAGSDDLAFITDTMLALPVPGEADAPEISRCARDREVLQKQLKELLAIDSNAACVVDDVVAATNRDPDALDALLSRQHYRLAYWRVAAHEINYRRFFDINTLIGLRAENAEVFTATHWLVLEWVNEGIIQGLRVDHPDGLRDPEGYFSRLSAGAPNAWIVAEKVLQPGERLPAGWPIDGTTGYDFLNLVNSLFVDPEGAAGLTCFYTRFTGQSADFTDVARQKKHHILRTTFAGEVGRLADIFLDICRQHRQYRDYMRQEVREVLSEIIACFPVYRTYIRPHLLKEPAIDDVRHVQQAIAATRKHRPDIDDRLLAFFCDIFMLRVRGDTEGELILRFQQLTGPVMAKAIEDTAFYCYNRLVSLNEVGGNPGRFGTTLEEFHRVCRRMAEEWPHTMNTTSTHDTKRSEDVRARINLLAGIPDRWQEAVLHWSGLNERFRSQDMPDRNAEYLFYQTLVGTWPIETSRLEAYMRKAAREAKVHTSWTDPNAVYEDALSGFVSRVMENRAFLEGMEMFVHSLIPLGRINSLAQALIKFTAPGVPDIYQGCELWDLSLVDPDNRRPIDYDQRRSLLEHLDHLSTEQILARSDEGLPKLWLTRQALRLRGRLAPVFETGDYRPIMAVGEKARHVVAFSRQDEVVAVTPRLVISLGDDWGDTSLDLPVGHWRNELTGQAIQSGSVLLGDLLDRFPVALLVREGA